MFGGENNTNVSNNAVDTGIDSTTTWISTEIDKEMLEKRISTMFSQSILENYEIENNRLVIILSDRNIDDEFTKSTYFTTGDKIEKIFTVDLFRIMTDFPGLNNISISITAGDQKYETKQNKEGIESYYGIKFTELHSPELSMKSEAWLKFINEDLADQIREEYFNLNHIVEKL